MMSAVHRYRGEWWMLQCLACTFSNTFRISLSILTFLIDNSKDVFVHPGKQRFDVAYVFIQRRRLETPGEDVSADS